MNNEKYIVFEADSFCYGPASIALAIAEQVLQHVVPSSVKFIALGKETSYELFSSSNLFDAVYHFDYTQWTDCPDILKEILLRSSAIVCVVDFEFSKMINCLGLKSIFVDPLYRMWDKPPIKLDSCKPYYALYFPGIEQNMTRFASLSDDIAPIVVNAIRDNSNLEKAASLAEKNTLLINFGGMQSPLGCNFDLALSMSRVILETALSENLYDEILICSGRNPIKRLREELENFDKNVKIRALSQKDFFVELATCRTFMTIPGLSIVYEALYFSKTTLFLLPLNYSQHHHTEVYKRILKNFHFISWDDFHGYETLPPGLPEEQGVELSFQLGKRFYSDTLTQQKFKEMILEFLHLPSSQGVTLSGQKDASNNLKFDGATQIAVEIISTKNLNEKSKKPLIGVSDEY